MREFYLVTLLPCMAAVCLAAGGIGCEETEENITPKNNKL